MLKNYDRIIITNLPSFYKTALFERVNLSKPLLVIYTGYSPEKRSSSFFARTGSFDSIDISGSGVFKTLWKLFSILNRVSYRQVILGGWDEPAQWIMATLSPKRKNAMILESSLSESTVTGPKSWVKKYFLKRVSLVYASGIMQRKLLECLGYQEKIIITGGVGLYNRKTPPPFEPRAEVKDLLFVGRLSPEKNLSYLIEKMKCFPHLNLHIVGYGPDEHELQRIAGKNITFHGEISNTDLFSFYSKYDVLILPSLREVWGLVVEEAMNAGMPVMVSDRVGSVGQVVEDGKNGIVFSLLEGELEKALYKIQELDFYNILRRNVAETPFEDIEEAQIKAYVEN